MSSLAPLYYRVDEPAVLQQLLDARTHDAAAFQAAFASLAGKARQGRGQPLRALRILAARQTREMARALLGEEVLRRQASASTMVDYGRRVATPCSLRGGHATRYRVVAGDCLQVAVEMSRARAPDAPRVAVLNMASARHPGGGYRNGAGAQEEYLFRTTSYMYALEDVDRMASERRWKYPIPPRGGIYSPDVTVLRGSEADGFPLLAAPYTRVAMLAVAAIARPPTVQKRGKTILAPSAANETRERIRAMLLLAHENGHDALVLSAFGCGAYRNPPEDIAVLFRAVLVDEFPGVFADVTFAIFDDHNARGEGNVAPFQRVFADLVDDTDA